jgi:nicotinamide phosphoribosyltransferase
MIHENPIYATDAYKLSHRAQYPKNTTLVYSNWTPRSSRHYQGNNTDGVVVFGIQIVLKKLIADFEDHFFSADKELMVEEYSALMSEFMGSEYDADHIGYLHDLGYLPLVIKALPEGTMCPIGVPAVTVYNTDPKCFWLTNYLETLFSAELWPYMTNATIAREYKQILMKYARLTGTPVDFVDWQGHSFAMRGLFGRHSSVCGLAHLTSFTGTDTIPAFLAAKEYYNANGLIAGSVPASEHSVASSHYEGEGDERAYIRHMLDLYPTGIVSIVADTYDYWSLLNLLCTEFKAEIMARDGRVVVRPDSGDIVDMICGKIYKRFDKPETFEEFKEWATEYLDTELREDTPHGECGGDITKVISYKGELYSVKYSPDWNRYDKQYYYIDNYGKDSDKSTFTKLENSPEFKGSIEVLWDAFGGTEVEGSDGNMYKHLDTHIGLIYGDSVTIPIANKICERLVAKGFSTNNLVLGIGSYTYQMNTRDTFGFAMKATYIEQSVKLPRHSMDQEHVEYETRGKEIFKDPKTKGGMNKKSLKGLISVGRQDDKIKAFDGVTWSVENAGELKEVFRDGKLLIDESLDTIRQRINEQL